MKRLTEKDESPCTECAGIGHCKVDCSYKKLYDRLAEYEDTGLEPKELNEKMNEAYDLGAQSVLRYKGLTWSEAEELLRYRDAEEQGLLVWLPCKPGDTVYWLNYNRSACKTCDLLLSFYGVDCMCDKHYELHPEINSVYDDEHCPKHFIEIVNRKADLEWIVYHLNDFGKTIFLTQEAAEKALEEA